MLLITFIYHKSIMSELCHDMPECCICLTRIYENPNYVITSCSTYICKSCLSQLRLNPNNNKCPNCRFNDLDKHLIVGSILEMTTQLINDRYYACIYEECKSIIKLGAYMEHVLACGYARIVCPNNALCTGFYKKDMELHKTMCIYRNVPCKICGISYFAKDHNELSCPERKVKCDSENCEVVTEYKNMPTHSNLCIKKIVSCPNAVFGCTEKQMQSLMHLHANTCSYKLYLCRCGVKVPKIMKHMHKSKCGRGIIECSHCKIKLFRKTYNDHINTCLEYSLICKCHMYIKRKSIIAHQLVCAKAITKCEYCNKEMVRQELITHYSLCIEKPYKCDQCDMMIKEYNKLAHSRVCIGQYIICPKYKEGLVCVGQWKNNVENKHKCTKVMQHETDLEPVKYKNGYYVDALDKTNKWCQARIFDIDEKKRTYTICFLHWDSQFDEKNISFDADRLMPFSTITRHGLYIGRTLVYANNYVLNKYRITEIAGDNINAINIRNNRVEAVSIRDDNGHYKVYSLKKLGYKTYDIDIGMIFVWKDNKTFNTLKIINIVNDTVYFTILNNATSYFKTTSGLHMKIDVLLENCYIW